MDRAMYGTLFWISAPEKRAPDGPEGGKAHVGAVCASAARRSSLHLLGGQNNLDRPRSSFITDVRSAVVAGCFLLDDSSELFPI